MFLIRMKSVRTCLGFHSTYKTPFFRNDAFHKNASFFKEDVHKIGDAKNRDTVEHASNIFVLKQK
jgi:hypothetical protein